MKRKSLVTMVLWILVVLLLPIPMSVKASENTEENINRYNVVIVLDASGSMKKTDPDGYRYEAIKQFTSLLAEQGNVLGGVVFHTDIASEIAPEKITNQSGKDKVTNMLESVPSNGGWTNIGKGLDRAIELLKTNGDPSLPSLILFLSDGNTDMKTEDLLKASLELKAEAIQKAREEKISVYSVCLNVNNAADITEMKQISDATGGAFQEVTKAEDLQNVFNLFYNLIYGTSTVTLVDDVFPSSGKLETPFIVPGLGVEEVNIVINGSAKAISLQDPKGNKSDAAITVSDTFTFIKVTDLVAGEWTLITEGVPGDQIKINMIYNTNLGVDVSILPSSLQTSEGNSVEIFTVLKTGNVPATSNEQYVGYSATAHILDAYGDPITTLPMEVRDGAFYAAYMPKQGAYFLQISIEGNYIEAQSETFGPIVVTAPIITEPDDTSVPKPPVVVNTPPTPEDTPINKTVYVWPFVGGSLTIDMSKLATDAEDEELRYKLLSSSFIEGKDYTVEGNIITLSDFSLSKGSFEIKATDSGGLSCNIEVVVKSYNVGIMACIALAIIALIVLAVIIGNIWYWSRKPFRGSISVQSYSNGNYRGTPRSPKRGKCKLAVFQLDPVGLDYQKSYFQATGQQFIMLNTNIPVVCNGQRTNRVRIQSGAEVTVSVKEGDSKLLYIRFDSRMRGNSRGPQRRPTTRRR